MVDSIAADEYSELVTGESGTVIRHDNLREPMSGKNQLEFSRRNASLVVESGVIR